jgi:hypothetical protein
VKSEVTRRERAASFGFLGAKGMVGRPPVIPPGAGDMRDHEGDDFLGVAGEVYRELSVHRPELRDLVDQHANISCLDYAAHFFRHDCGMSAVLVDALGTHAERLHGTTVARKVAEAARDCSAIATGEHAAFLGDVMQFQSALMLSAGAEQAGVPAVLSVPFGNVPLDNSSTRPGSVLWKDRHYRWTSNQRDARRALAYGSAAMSRDRLAERFPGPLYSTIGHMFPDAMFADNLEFLTDQFAVANRVLWDQTLGDVEGLAPFVQIPAEELVGTLLADSFKRRDVFHQMIFDRRCRAAYVEGFEGIRSCHRSPPERRAFGTHFFWGRSERSGRQLHYFLEHPDSDVLQPFVSVQGEMQVPADKHAAAALRLETGGEDEILARLANRTLVPSVFLSLTLLASHGATNNGGYQQTDYFKKVKRAMISYLRDRAELGDPSARARELARWERVETGGFCLGPLFLLKPETTPESCGDLGASLDALWDLPIAERRGRVLQALSSVTFWQAVLAGATRFYPSIVQDAAYSVPELMNLRVEDVLPRTRYRS